MSLTHWTPAHRRKYNQTMRRKRFAAANPDLVSITPAKNKGTTIDKAFDSDFGKTTPDSWDEQTFTVRGAIEKLQKELDALRNFIGL